MKAPIRMLDILSLLIFVWRPGWFSIRFGP